MVRCGSRIKILYVCPKYYPLIGGIPVHVKNLAERLAKFHDVSVFVPNHGKGLSSEEEINNVKVRRFRSIAPDDSYHLSFSLSLAARQHKADIVHIHGYDNLLPPLTILLKNRNQRCLLTLHSSGSSSGMRKLLRVPYNLAMRRVMRRVDRVICVSRFELDYFRSVLRLPLEKMELIPSARARAPNGVNPIKLESQNSNKARLMTILSVGRLEKYKGHQRVIRAFGIFRQFLPEIETELSILGKGPYKQALEREVEKLQLKNSVRFLDWLPTSQYLKLLAQSTMLILLSDYEAQSIVLSEALSTRTPVIVANNSSSTEYVQSGSAIGVENPNDPYEVVEKMKMILNNPQCCKFSLPENATWDQVTAKVFAAYCEVLRR